MTNDLARSARVVRVGVSVMLLSLAVPMLGTIRDSTKATLEAPGLKITRTVVGTWRGQFPKEPVVSRDVFNAIDFTGPDDGWVAGPGRIMATDDGGKQWRTVYQGAIHFLGLAMLNAEQGYAYGPLHVLYTKDGGKHWHEVSQPDGRISVIDPVAPNQTYAVADGEVYVSKNHGHNWTRVTTPGDVSSVAFDAHGVGYAVSSMTAQVWKTTDFGQKWQVSLHLKQGAGGTVRLSGGAVWVVIDGGAGMYQLSYSLYESTDGGVQWQAKGTHPTAGGGSAPGTPARAYLLPGTTLVDFQTLTAKRALLVTGCWACGAGTIQLSATTDGGTHWINHPDVSGYEGFSAAISFISSQTGWLATASGLILSTRNGGNTWTERYPIQPLAPIYGWWWLNNTVGFGVGKVGDANALLETTNGGQRWKQIGVLPSTPGPSFPSVNTQAIDFVNPNDGWIVSPASDRLYHDHDGTLSALPVQTFMSKRNPHGQVTSVFFSNRNDGAVSTLESHAWYTLNGGKTWRRSVYDDGAIALIAKTHPQLAQTLARLSNQSQTIGYQSIGMNASRIWLNIGSGATYLISDNHGATWRELTFKRYGPQMMTFSPTGRGFAVNGSYWMTDNQGKTWLPLLP